METVRVDLLAYLFGDILAVTDGDLLWIYGGGVPSLALLVGPVLYWLYIFYRRRGIKVLLRSRPQLSLSALLIGEMAVLTMVSLDVPLPFEAAEFSAAQLAIYIAVQLALVSVWAALFFRPRQAAEGATGDTVAVES